MNAATRHKRLSLAALLGRRGQGGRLPDLGERELGVLEVLWRSGPQNPQGVLERMGNARISLSTIQSTLERLYRKGLLKRDKDGRSFVYRPLLSKQNLISRLMHDIAESLTDGETAPMVSGFLDYLDDRDDAAGAALRGRQATGRRRAK